MQKSYPQRLRRTTTRSILLRKPAVVSYYMGNKILRRRSGNKPRPGPAVLVETFHTLTCCAEHTALMHILALVILNFPILPWTIDWGWWTGRHSFCTLGTLRFGEQSTDEHTNTYLPGIRFSWALTTAAYVISCSTAVVSCMWVLQTANPPSNMTGATARILRYVYAANLFVDWLACQRKYE